MRTEAGDFFGRLWAALTISLVGSEITLLALPLFAVLTLGASSLEMGILAAAGQIPFLLFSLPAGVWVDRLRRRPILIVCDLGSAALLLSVPLAVPLGGPSFAQLCLVAFGVGALTVVSEVAHYAYVPSLVGRTRLTTYNTKLQVSYSFASAAGPGIGGLLVQLVSAPVAVLADAASFLTSAGLLAGIRHAEPMPARATAIGSWRTSMTGGMRALLGHPLLRPIILGGSVANLFNSAFLALYVLYATRELGLNPATVGLLFAVGGVGAIPGALVAELAGRRWGIGPSIIGGWAVSAVSALAVPLAGGSPLQVVAMLAIANAAGGLTSTVANIHQWSLRQTVTPDHLSGRVTASHRFIVYGAGAAGALLGGGAGALLGLRPTLLACALGMFAGPLVAIVSPLRRLQRMPIPADAP